MSRSSRSRLAAVLVVCAGLLLAGCGGGAGGTDEAEVTVRVAAASDVQPAMTELLAAFDERDRGIKVDTTFGSSGTFLTQLQNGAPFDLYLSADLTYAEQLVDEGLADEGDLFQYAVGRIVLWAPNGSPVDVSTGLAGLDQPGLRSLAIANPEHAPYGVAAVAAMKDAGVYDDVEDKLVLGENVAQAAEFASSGNAQAGVIALSQALTPALEERGSFVRIPLDSYPEIDQGGVVMSSARDKEAARSFRDFLVSDEGRAILARYGFSLPDA